MDGKCPDHRPVHDSAVGWYCAACGSEDPPGTEPPSSDPNPGNPTP